MSDIRKRNGKKGPTYQVRYADKSSKTGYSYKTFETKKEALAFREDAQSHQRTGPLSKEINTVAQGMQKWLDVCEKEGRDGKDPVTDYALKNYEWRRDHIIKYPWLSRCRYRHASAGIYCRSDLQCSGKRSEG